MNSYAIQSCRACLLQDNVCNMYDLAVPETLELYIQCSNVAISIKSFPASPQHLCSMCYRLCEMIESFRERCQETEKKLMRAKLKRRSATKVAVAASAAPRPPIKAEREVAEAGEVEGNELQEEVDTHYGAVEYDAPIAEAGGGNEEVDHEETCDPTQIDIQWDDYESESDTKNAKKKRKTDHNAWASMNPDEFLWGPGPNDTGVWKHFMRESSRKYAKCTLEGCLRVLCCPNGSTTSMRTHLTKVHGMEVPLRPKTWLTNSN